MQKTAVGKITDKFATFTVKYRWPMAILFLVLSVVCAVVIPFTKIVYDVSTYLPDESVSAVGLDVLKQEFDDKGMTYVILPDVTVQEAKDISDELSKTDGVASIIFEPTTS